MKRFVIGLAALLLAPFIGVSAATSAAAEDWMSSDMTRVTTVLVDKLGGVNVSGLVSCAATRDSVRESIAAGEFWAQNFGNGGQYEQVVLGPDDHINLMANSDIYTVTQPAGKKTMLQVSHQSSRMSPCFVEEFVDGPPTANPCNEFGAPCRWETDIFGYDHDALGPLFDYSPNGQIKTGTVSVNQQSIGLGIQVVRADGTTDGPYYVEDGSWAVTTQSVRAVRYRG